MDPVINHISSLMEGGSLAQSVLAAEVNFATSALTVTAYEKSGTTCKVTVTHAATPVDEKVPFVDQTWIIAGIDAAKFNGTFKCTQVTVVNSTTTVIWYTHSASHEVAYTVSNIVNGATPKFAFGLTSTNKFSTNNAVGASASDGTAGKNQVLLGGRFAAYLTNLSNYIAGLQDIFNNDFSLYIKIRCAGTGNNVDNGFLIRDAAGNAMLITFSVRQTSLGALCLSYFNNTTKVVSKLYNQVGYQNGATGTGVVAASQTFVLKVNLYKDVNGKLSIIKFLQTNDTELQVVNIPAAYQMLFPFHIGPCAGQDYNNDVIATKTIVDYMYVKFVEG